jgi:hypothetical protein
MVRNQQLLPNGHELVQVAGQDPAVHFHLKTGLGESDKAHAQSFGTHLRVHVEPEK